MLEIESLDDRHAMVDEEDLVARQLGQALAGGDMLEGNGVRAHDLDTQAAEPVDGFHTGSRHAALEVEIGLSIVPVAPPAGAHEDRLAPSARDACDAPRLPQLGPRYLVPRPPGVGPAPPGRRA